MLRTRARLTTETTIVSLRTAVARATAAWTIPSLYGRTGTISVPLLSSLTLRKNKPGESASHVFDVKWTAVPCQQRLRSGIHNLLKAFTGFGRILSEPRG